MPAPAPAYVLRIASYNIHRCIGLDGREDPARIGAVLRELDADVVAVQEVEHEKTPDGPADLRFLNDVPGYHVTLGFALEREDSHYGNILLTRPPPIAIRRFDLSVPGREPRGAIDVELGGPGPVVRVVATHLGLSARERAYQIGRLGEVLAAGERPAPCVVVGDFNEWWPWSRNLRRLRRRFGAVVTPGRSFPAGRPLFSLDRFYVRPPLEMRAAVVHATPLARIASDHRPVVAEIHWPPRPPLAALVAEARAPEPGPFPATPGGGSVPAEALESL